MNRRRFLVTGTALAAATCLPRRLLAADTTRVVLLHTNDTHSRLDPFPLDGGRYEGLGGVARRKTLIDRIRKAEPHVVVTDSGDVFQGTPYFNFFGGVPEYEAMSRLGYDLATLGNHDFDSGVDTLKKAMDHATFQFVCANLRATDPGLAGRLKPYVVKTFGDVRVGFLGLTVAFEGLVGPHLHAGVEYVDVLDAARRTVATLRETEKVHAVVALTHLGMTDEPHSPGDVTLASQVNGIDLILGGHSHSWLKKPKLVTNPDGGTTQIQQVGFAGIWLGRVDLRFEGTRLAAIDAGHQVV
jgi:5'-nucleotidase